MQDYHKLEIWHGAMDFVADVYQFIGELPDSERLNLADQLRRAATSVPLNIAEACGTSTPREFTVFLGYAYRSIKEVITALELCERLFKPPVADSARDLVEAGEVLSRMTRALLQKAGGSSPTSASAPSGGAMGRPPTTQP
jgi:four helix bundle protein